MNKKVLIISFYFPPYNSIYETIASLRIEKFCKYLPFFGWKPYVLTKTYNEKFYIDKWNNIEIFRVGFHKNRFLDRIDKSFMGRQRYKSWWSQSWLRKYLIFLIKELLFYPDEYKAWINSAVKVGEKIIKQKNIDLIFSSSLPPSCHLIAYKLVKATNLPWIAEYRDLWTYNPYIKHTFIRKCLEKELEASIIKEAKLLITVSEPLAEKLRQLHHKSVEVITNGFDEEDYDFNVPLTSFFSITYTGQIYEGKQDPSLLFLAVSELIKEDKIDKKKFKIRFFGPEKDIPKIYKLAKKYEIEDIAVHLGEISYKESIIRQKESTVLLLLNWTSLNEKGIYTGKIFEYLGAKRPVIALPKIENGVVEELLRQTKIGVSLSKVDEIKNLIKNWYDEFFTTGDIKLELDEEKIKNFTRKELTKKLSCIFNTLVKN